MKAGIAVLAIVSSGVLGMLAGRWSAPSNGDLGSAPIPKEFTGTVVRVGDGDTLELAPVEPPGAVEKIRLLGIDAPNQGRPMFKESSAALTAITSAGPIRVEFERPGHGQRDNYGRLLAYVFAGEKNVNIELVREGWAVYSSKHGGVRFAAELRGAEDEARAARRGLWKSQK